MHLDDSRTIQSIIYRFKDKALIYGISCMDAGKIYIGSTMTPSLRFNNHLISGNHSNEALQAAISAYGLAAFKVHIFELVEFDDGMTFKLKNAKLRTLEQKYMDMVPPHRLFNSLKAIKWLHH